MKSKKKLRKESRKKIREGGGVKMLKKIYQELVEIRKELHNISNAMEPNSTDAIINEMVNQLNESMQDFHY